MDFHGMQLEGYALGTSTGLATCGMGTLGRLSGCNVSAGFDEILKGVFTKIRWTGTRADHGTLVFSLSSTQIHSRSGFTKYLAEHPNTRCMHHYTNDAHGPNMVFLCVHHLNQTNTKPREQPQLMEVFNKTTFSGGVWRMI